jgi:gas vesicle protein
LAFNALKQTKINQLIRIRVKLSERFAKTVEKQVEPVVEVVEKKTEIDTSAWTETEIRGRRAYVDKYGNFKMFKQI